MITVQLEENEWLSALTILGRANVEGWDRKGLLGKIQNQIKEQKG